MLKTGKTVEGELIEKTDKYIKIDFYGVPLTYFFDEIESIDGQKQAQAAEINKSTAVGTSAVDSSGAREPEANSNKPASKLPFSTAVITYEDSGDIFNGEEVAYIDATKNKVSRDTRVEGKINGLTKKINKRDICDGAILYHVDFEDKTAPSFPVEKGDAFSSIFNEGMYSKYYKGNDTFLGKECKVYKAPGAEAYFWNGIMLKEKITDHPMGPRFNVTKEAVDIKLNVPIADDKFRVPSGIKVMNPEETLGDLKKMLKDLQGGKKEDWERLQKDIEKIGGK